MKSGLGWTNADAAKLLDKPETSVRQQTAESQNRAFPAWGRAMVLKYEHFYSNLSDYIMKFSYEKYPVLKYLASDKEVFFKPDEIGLYGAGLKTIEYVSTYFNAEKHAIKNNVVYVSKPVYDTFHLNEKVANALWKLRNELNEASSMVILPTDEHIMYSIIKHPDIIQIHILAFISNKALKEMKSYDADYRQHVNNNLNFDPKSLVTCCGSVFWQLNDIEFDTINIHPITWSITGKSDLIADLAYSVIQYELFKQYAELETAYVQKGNRKKATIANEKFLSDKYPYKIQIINSNWFTTIHRTEGFSVKGHFRLQSCGEGMKDRKIIWINPFEKKG